MAGLQSNLPQDSMKPYQSKEYYPQKAKGLSLLAFFFSLFAYTSIFYIFNLSLSTLFTNTKFWFAISNTLILIIAADYGAFSSSKARQDHLNHQDFLMYTHARNATSSFVSQYPQLPAVKKTIGPDREDVQENRNATSSFASQYPQLPDVKKTIGADREDVQEHRNATSSFVSQYPQPDVKKPVSPDREDVQEKRVVLHVSKGDDDVGGRKNVDRQTKTYMRSNSEKTKRAVIDEPKNTTHRRSESTDSPEDNEFSSMSDEELNKRVEEFIQKFNRQIRLQSADPRIANQVIHVGNVKELAS